MSILLTCLSVIKLKESEGNRPTDNNNNNNNNNVVRLSLLTMTNPDQLCDMLLFVYSKVADETNLSSKLPVADRTREV